PLDAVERYDRLQDPPAVRIGRKLGVRALGPRRVSRLDLSYRHSELERVDTDLRLDLESGREDRKTLHETPGKDPVAGENVGEAASEQAGKQAGEQLVPDDVAAAKGLFLFVAAGPDDHVELFGDEHVDHRRSGLGIVGEIAVRYHVDVGVDVGEHPTDDVPLPLLALRADDRTSLGSDLAGPVRAVVVVDVDGGGGQRLLEAGNSGGDRRLLIVTWQEHGDARLRLRTVQAIPHLLQPAIAARWLPATTESRTCPRRGARACPAESQRHRPGPARDYRRNRDEQNRRGQNRTSARRRAVRIRSGLRCSCGVS